jgi:AraC-like DNA-binding protein
MKPNQFSIFRPEEIHQTKPIKKTTGYYSLYFDNQFIKTYFPIVLDTNVINDEKLYSNLLNISNSLLDDKEDIEDKLLDFFEQLSLNYFKHIKEDVKELILINDIKEYIVTNIDFPPTLDEISKKYNLSKEHIIRVFKKELGLTPHAFITNYKINHAKNLLSTNSLKSLSEVAIESGFYDQSHFSKAFKRVFAITPSKITK